MRGLLSQAGVDLRAAIVDRALEVSRSEIRNEKAQVRSHAGTSGVFATEFLGLLEPQKVDLMISYILPEK
jgi:hypothetical protein